ncbi:hypothetical protein HMPREF1980_00460 [Actinomyces sp. oral taxon 172 str. F0311]|nr:hypothetical protein HMPREF1980_00460 [Actinomyces sp. oral taxon 172 str. F0311]
MHATLLGNCWVWVDEVWVQRAVKRRRGGIAGSTREIRSRPPHRGGCQSA